MRATIRVRTQDCGYITKSDKEPQRNLSQLRWGFFFVLQVQDFSKLHCSWRIHAGLHTSALLLNSQHIKRKLLFLLLFFR